MQAAWLILLVSLFAWPLAAQQAPAIRPADGAQPIAGRLADWLRTLDSFAASLAQGETPTPELVAMRPVLDVMRGAAETAKLRLRALAAEKQGLLDALGPAPGEGAPETMAITAQRGQLNTALAADLDQLKQLDLVSARAQALIDRIDKMQQQRLAQELGHRGASPFDGATLSAAMPQFVGLMGRLIMAPADWATNAVIEHRGRLTSLTLAWVAFAVIVAGATVGGRTLRRRFGRPRAAEPPGRTALYLGAFVDMPPCRSCCCMPV